MQTEQGVMMSLNKTLIKIIKKLSSSRTFITYYLAKQEGMCFYHLDMLGMLLKNY